MPTTFRRLPPISTLLALLVLATLPAAAEGWPQWRGPRLDGTSTETGLPTTWSREQNVRWRLALPGPGGATPVVWDGQVFVTSTVEGSDELVLLAVDPGGEVAWRRTVDRGAQKVPGFARDETTLASPSPVTDGEHVWGFFGTAKLVAFTVDGEEVWRRDLAKDHGAPDTYFGLSSSPLLHEGRLYIQMLHTGRQLVLAVDATSGRDVWAHDRRTDARAECLHAYTSPTVFTAPSGDLLLIHGADYLSAHRLSDGAEVWRHGGLNPEDGYNPTLRLVATPVVADDLVVVPSAKRGPVYGLRPAGAEGDVTGAERHTAWKLERGTPDVPSPLVHGGLVYLAGEKGRLTVLDAASGAEVYAERVHQSTHRASPVVADGKLFVAATDGTVSVLRPGREYELLAKNDLGEYLAASPAVADGTLYLRTYDALYAVGEPPARDEPADSEPAR